MNDKPTKDTIGTAIAHKNIDGQELVAVAIRGSKYNMTVSGLQISPQVRRATYKASTMPRRR